MALPPPCSHHERGRRLGSIASMVDRYLCSHAADSPSGVPTNYITAVHSVGSNYTTARAICIDLWSCTALIDVRVAVLKEELSDCRAVLYGWCMDHRCPLCSCCGNVSQFKIWPVDIRVWWFSNAHLNTVPSVPFPPHVEGPSERTLLAWFPCASSTSETLTQRTALREYCFILFYFICLPMRPDCRIARK